MITIIFQIGNLSWSVRKGICFELDSASSGRPGLHPSLLRDFRES
jgi:hypothetical protein